MTTINTIEELIELLHSDPKWAEELRKALLTEDFHSLPSEFRLHPQRMESMLDSNQELLKQLVEGSARAMSGIDRMEKEWSIIENQTTRIESRKYAPDLAADLAADLDLRFIRCLKPEELVEMAQVAGLMGAQRRSFTQADLVILAHGWGSEQDRTRYITAEVPLTGTSRDTARALSNAFIVPRITGEPCEYALISVRNDEGANEQIRDRLLHRFKMEEPEPEIP